MHVVASPATTVAGEQLTLVVVLWASGSGPAAMPSGCALVPTVAGDFADSAPVSGSMSYWETFSLKVLVT